MTIFKSVVATFNCKFHVKKSTLLKTNCLSTSQPNTNVDPFSDERCFQKPELFFFLFLYRCLGMLEYYSVKPEDVYN